MLFPRRPHTLFYFKNTGIMLLGIAGAIGAVMVMSAKIHAVADTIERERALGATLQARNDALATLERDYAAILATQPSIERSIPSADNVIEFSDTLESIAAKYNMTQALRFDSPEKTTVTFGAPQATLMHVGFTLSLSTNMFIFMEYLKELEELPYLVTIDSITVAGQGERGWSDTSLITLHGVLTARLTGAVE